MLDFGLNLKQNKTLVALTECECRLLRKTEPDKAAAQLPPQIQCLPDQLSCLCICDLLRFWTFSNSAIMAVPTYEDLSATYTDAGELRTS